MVIKMFRVGIITVSDKGSRGEREDKTGQVIKELLEGNQYKIVHYNVIPDEIELIENEIKALCDEDIADLILTNGGTGFSLRDVTPEATKNVIDREVPGIPEFMRYKSMEITDRSMLSRAAAGIRKSTLIINLPGSPKAAKENLGWILGALPHGLEILIGSAGECAR